MVNVAEVPRDARGRFVPRAMENDGREAKVSLAASNTVNGVYQWKAETVYEDPSLPGYRVVHLLDEMDLARWGQQQMHCGGSHYKWTTLERRWYFFTVLRPGGKSDGTLHMKPVEYLFVRHPDDNKGPTKGNTLYTGPSHGGESYARSTTYDTTYNNVYADYYDSHGMRHGVPELKEAGNKSYEFDGKPQAILSLECGHKAPDKVVQMFAGFLNSLPSEPMDWGAIARRAHPHDY